MFCRGQGAPEQKNPEEPKAGVVVNGTWLRRQRRLMSLQAPGSKKHDPSVLREQWCGKKMWTTYLLNLGQSVACLICLFFLLGEQESFPCLCHIRSLLRTALPSSECLYSVRCHHLPFDDLVSFHRRPSIPAAKALFVLFPAHFKNVRTSSAA